MKKINVFLPILLISGILNNSSIYAGSSCSRMMQVETINIPRENSQTRSFDSIPNETQDFRNFEDFKALINVGKKGKGDRDLVIETVEKQINSMHTINIFDEMHIDRKNIFNAIACRDLNKILNFRDKINTPNPDLFNDFPLHYAIMSHQPSESPAIIFLLLLLGAKTDSVNQDGDTPLNLLFKRKYSDLLIQQSLLLGGANPNTPDAKNKSPLINLISNPLCQPEAVELLINSGANVNYNASRDPIHPFTALSTATKIYNEEKKRTEPKNKQVRKQIINLLKKAGAKI